MDPQTLLYRLKIPLTEKDYGNTATEVLATCALVAEYAQEHTPDQVRAFQESVQINPQVWSRLIALHKDKRLKAHLERLPRSYTALYAISRMEDQEIDAAVKQGIIHPAASSHSILKWSKEHRLVDAGTITPLKCMIAFDRQLEPAEINQMRSQIIGVLEEYSARLIDLQDLPNAPKRNQDTRAKHLEEVEESLRELLSPLFDLLLEQERNRYGINDLDDFMCLGLAEFKKSVKSARCRTVPSLATGKYGEEYVLKLALEYLKTDSRSQRFNYKRRLQELAELQPELQQSISRASESYMTEKKAVTSVRPIQSKMHIPDFFSLDSKTL